MLVVADGDDCDLPGVTGHRLQVGIDPETHPGDVPVYISDCAALHELTEWRPRRGAAEILADIHTWIGENERAVLGAL
jgi:UDP-glucose 4-epimerase